MPARDRLAGVGIDDAHADAGQRMADPAALRADLAEAGRAEVARVDGNDRRALGAAVAFERADAEAVLEREREALRQFFGADDHELQAAEIFRRAAAHVDLQERRRRQQERDAVLADELADGFGVERVGMIDDADAEHRGQPERDGEAEGMEEGQDAEQAYRRWSSMKIWPSCSMLEAML